MNFIITLILCLVATAWGTENTFNVDIKAQHSAPMRMIIGVYGQGNTSIKEVADTLKRDLEFEGHFDIVCQNVAPERTSKEMSALAMEYPLALFLTYTVSQGMHEMKQAYVEWYLYDTYQQAMLGGKRHIVQQESKRGWGHELAEQISELLLGTRVCFASRIAYCKDVHIPGKRSVRHICVADLTDGYQDHELVIARSTLNIAPRWNRDFWHPLLFYSEGTDKNFRLIVNDLAGRSWIASNGDGINMQPTFSADGTWVVFCASRGTGSSQLYSYKQGVLQRLTYLDGNSLAPTMTADGERIYFCSDHEGRSPAIYCYSVSSGKSTRITHGGMAFSPHYCDIKKQLVYTQATQGYYQIWIYDEQTKEHRQLTFDPENKEECSWSPCGTYVAYCATCQGKGRICIYNVQTGKKRYLTSSDQDCSYPIWSPSYAYYPSVNKYKK